MDNLEKKLALSLIMALVIAAAILFYWIREPARQEAAIARIGGETMERGSALFVANCASCHGRAGDALPGINLRQTQLKETGLVKQISRGSSGMPAFSEEDGGPLNQHQIKDLVTFIQNWDQSLIESSSAPEQVPAATSGPEAAIQAGKDAFSRLNCTLCHGNQAQGNIGPSLMGKDAETVRRVVRSGATGMPTFSSEQLSNSELEDIIAYLASLK